MTQRHIPSTRYCIFSFNRKIIAGIAPYVQVLELYVAPAINPTKWRIIVFGESKRKKQRMKKLFSALW